MAEFRGSLHTANDLNSKLGDFHYTGTKGSFDYTYDGTRKLDVSFLS
jgi:hypothetical protein